MQITLDKSDRKLLMWTGIILVPLVLALALFSSKEDEDSGIPSSYSAKSHGAKAAYLLLKEEGYRVERWENPPDQLPEDAHNTVLVLAGPTQVPSKDEKNALHTYLNRGGTILATGYEASIFLPQADAVLEPLPSAVWKDYHPEMLSKLTRAGTIKMSPAAHWGDALPEQSVHYAHDGKGIVVSYKVGEGEVIWWAGATPLTNLGIREAGNLDLFLNSLGASKNVHVFWDEYFHTSHRADVRYWSLPPIGFGLLQCGLAFLAFVLTFSRRHAPIRKLTEPSRLSPLEFVNTLGSLYHRANATRTALEVPYNRFRTLLTRRLGLRADTSSADLVRGAQNRMGYKDPAFQQTLSDIETGLHDLDLSEARVLQLVQQLSVHAHNLKLVFQEEQEKT
jgi:hypothetical protein